MQQYNEFNKFIKYNRYYIYEFIQNILYKTSDSHRLLLNLSNKINLKRNDKYVALSNLSIYYTWKNIKKSYKNNNKF